MKTYKIIIVCGIVIVLSIIILSFYRLFTLYSASSDQLKNIPYTLTLPLKVDDNQLYTIPCNIAGKQLNLKIDNMAFSILPEEFILKHGGIYGVKSIIPTFDAYGSLSFKDLYYFPEAKIDTLSLFKPSFFSQQERTFIHSIMDEGVFGNNLLRIGCWQFNMDKNKLIAFDRGNINYLKEITENMSSIQKRFDSDDFFKLNLIDVNLELNLGFDLGFSDEIEVDNAVREELIKVFPHKKVCRLIQLDSTSKVDTVYVFENIDVQLDKYKIDSCRIVNIPNVNLNYAGALFMQNLNFVLEYTEHSSDQKLYFEKAASRKKYDYIPLYDFSITYNSKKEVIIDRLSSDSKINSELQLGDKILSVNVGEFDLSLPNIRYRFHDFCNISSNISIKIERDNKQYLIHL